MVNWYAFANAEDLLPMARTSPIYLRTRRSNL